MNEPMTEPYFCGECDEAPPGWDHFSPMWRYCPIHGTRLASPAEMEEDAAQVRADAVADERFVDQWDEVNSFAYRCATGRVT